MLLWLQGLREKEAGPVVTRGWAWCGRDEGGDGRARPGWSSGIGGIVGDGAAVGW